MAENTDWMSSLLGSMFPANPYQESQGESSLLGQVPQVFHNPYGKAYGWEGKTFGEIMKDEQKRKMLLKILAEMAAKDREAGIPGTSEIGSRPAGAR